MIVEMFVKETQLTKYDSLINPSSFQEENFTSVARTKERLVLFADVDDIDVLIEIELKSDKFFTVQSRSVYSILDVLSNIGGLNGMIFSIGGALVGWLSSRMMDAAIVSSIFHIEEKSDITTQNSEITLQNNESSKT
jgi:hypothetical protein